MRLMAATFLVLVGCFDAYDATLEPVQENDPVVIEFVAAMTLANWSNSQLIRWGTLTSEDGACERCHIGTNGVTFAVSAELGFERNRTIPEVFGFFAKGTGGLMEFEEEKFDRFLLGPSDHPALIDAAKQINPALGMSPYDAAKKAANDFVKATYAALGK